MQDQAFVLHDLLDMIVHQELQSFVKSEHMQMKVKELVLLDNKVICEILDQKHQLLLKIYVLRDLIVQLQEAQHCKLSVLKGNTV